MGEKLKAAGHRLLSGLCYIVMNWTLTTTFIVAFLAAWLANGLSATHFDLGALATGYAAVSGVSVCKFGINSTLNSPRGEKPL